MTTWAPRVVTLGEAVLLGCTSTAEDEPIYLPPECTAGTAELEVRGCGAGIPPEDCGEGFAPNDTLALGVSGVWGGDHPLGNGISGAGRNDDETGIVDFVLNWGPSDALPIWVNADYVWSEDDGAGWNSRAYGVAAAGRLALTDKTGVAMRGEFIEFDDEFLYGGGGPTDQRLWSLTGTLDHEITDNLVVRIEVRYEEGSQEDGPDAFGPLGVYWYELERKPKVAWKRHAISFKEGIGSALNVPVVDLDGDGDLDVVVTGKWAGPVWFENKRLDK